MLSNPSSKYRPFAPVQLADRQWPSRVITTPPMWMSTDLRDGNQSLFEPMNVEKKMRMFKTLCQVGFKEIEVAFPSASQTDFNFVRSLIEDGHIPQDVTIEVLTQAREHLIRRTMESIKGAPRAIVHVYNATSQPFRDFVFGMSKAEVVAMAVEAVTLIKQLAAEMPETEVVLEYSPETFTATELDFALEVCDAVTAAWGATPDNKVILNLPTTVEMATPNIYADQIEWMHRRLARRNAVILSVHPHNDRGTAVAAAELAVMAGAQRVEGCLFGNGERTGNVDIVTLAMNLYSQGVHPGLDFSDMAGVARTVEQCTALPIHPRHPYAGELVFTAFSGSHQDAIRKGMAAQQADAVWSVPYLPIDPQDVGCSYEAIVRVNSQSGKGGITYVLESVYGWHIPRKVQIEFSQIVQEEADATGREMTASVLADLFKSEYMEQTVPWQWVSHQVFEEAGITHIELIVTNPQGQQQRWTGQGNGPLDAAWHAMRALGMVADDIEWRGYSEHSTGQGSDAAAMAWIELGHPGQARSIYGSGRHANLVTACIQGLIQAVNRASTLNGRQP